MRATKKNVNHPNTLPGWKFWIVCAGLITFNLPVTVYSSLQCQTTTTAEAEKTTTTTPGPTTTTSCQFTTKPCPTTTTTGLTTTPPDPITTTPGLTPTTTGLTTTTAGRVTTTPGPTTTPPGPTTLPLCSSTPTTGPIITEPSPQDTTTTAPYPTTTSLGTTSTAPGTSTLAPCTTTSAPSLTTSAPGTINIVPDQSTSSPILVTDTEGLINKNTSRGSFKPFADLTSSTSTVTLPDCNLLKQITDETTSPTSSATATFTEKSTTSIVMRTTSKAWTFTEVQSTHWEPRSSSSSMVTLMTTTTRAPANTEPIVVVISPSIKINIGANVSIELPFDDSFTDLSTPEYQNLAQEFDHKITDLYRNVDGFVDVNITGFRKGSTVCDYKVIFEATVKLEIVVTTLADTTITIRNYTASMKTSVEALSQVQRDVDTGRICRFLENPCQVGFICKDILGNRNSYHCVHVCTSFQGLCGENGYCYFDYTTNSRSCKCKETDEVLYTGAQCEIKEKKPTTTSMSLAIYVGGFCVFIGVLAVAIVCLFLRRRKAKRRSNRHSNDKGQMDIHTCQPTNTFNRSPSLEDIFHDERQWQPGGVDPNPPSHLATTDYLSPANIYASIYDIESNQEPYHQLCNRREDDAMSETKTYMPIPEHQTTYDVMENDTRLDRTSINEDHASFQTTYFDH